MSVTTSKFPLFASEQTRENVLRNMRREFRPVRGTHGDIPDWAFWAAHPTRPGWYVVDVPPMNAVQWWDHGTWRVEWSMLTSKRCAQGMLVNVEGPK